MLFFVDQISERLIYTLNFIFHERGLVYSLTNDWKYFSEQEGPKIIYSEKYEEGYVMFQPASLLFDEAISSYKIEEGQFNQQACLSFNHVADPFASIFFVLSRYEEYTCKLKDVHDRFPAKESVLHRYNWLNFAICDRWAEVILSYLEQQTGTTFLRDQIETKLVPTFDIDNTFAFKWKDNWRKWFGIIREKLKNDNLRIEARKKFYNGEIDDPYDTFDYIRDITFQGFETKVFWLVGDYAKFDKNISIIDLRHQRHIKLLAKDIEIGIHPSYESNKSLLKLKNEISHLERILGRKVTRSRQHFLKLSIPASYKILVDLGFTDDYTMGYAEEVGFRAGTARPFYFFDLTKNNKTNLLIHPFVYMDGTLLEYKRYNPDQAKEQITSLYKEVKNYGGDFVFIWHNETIGDFGKWKGWKEVLEFTLNLKR
jgi:hypothetical protein